MRNAIRTFAYTLLFYCYRARLRFCLWTLTGFIPNIIASFSYGEQSTRARDDERKWQDPKL